MLKLPIESWIDQQNFSPDIRLLFSDSIKCYKADAFRASLLFSYLGFLTIIKERLLSTKKPPLFEQPYWDNNILKQIQNDDKWEAAVYQATQTEAKVKQGVKERDAIFSISTGLRNEISYWKNRRNDCAHFKANEINNFHVESFWSFLRSNLSKITVEGGIASLLAKFALHYDATHTPAGKDVSPLVAEISASVDPLNLATFWDKLETIIDNSHYYGSETFNLIAEKVFTLNDARLTASLRDFIKNNARRLRYYLSYKPSFIAQLDYTQQEIRNFWQEKVWRAENALDIYAAMLANSLIPANEVTDANEVAFNNAMDYTSNPTVHSILKTNGFSDLVEKKVFIDNQIHRFTWANKHARLVSEFVELNQLNDIIVKRISETFDSGTYSFVLASELDRLFAKNAAKKAEFVTLAATQSYSLPKHIPSLLT